MQEPDDHGLGQKLSVPDHLSGTLLCSTYSSRHSPDVAIVYDATSIQTVWLPCSNKNAKHRIMEGKKGLGKSLLDIKGKKSKQGILPAFIPLWQIHDKADKWNIQKILPNARMQVNSGSGLEARDLVVCFLKKYTLSENVQVKPPMWACILGTNSMYREHGPRFPTSPHYFFLDNEIVLFIDTHILNLV
jgi:hypothetical protein